MSVSILYYFPTILGDEMHNARAVVSYFELHLGIGNSKYLESRNAINWTRLGGSCMTPASRTAGRRSHNGRDIARKPQNGEASNHTSRW